jgi:hypothetical protein
VNEISTEGYLSGGGCSDGARPAHGTPQVKRGRHFKSCLLKLATVEPATSSPACAMVETLERSFAKTCAWEGH